MKPTAIKKLRASLGWSQDRLAKELGVERNTVNRWEMGVHPISLTATRLLKRLAVESENQPT